MKQIKSLSIFTFIIVLIALLGTTAPVRAASNYVSTWTSNHTFSTAGWSLLTCWTDPDNVYNNCYNSDNGAGDNYGSLQIRNGFATLGRQFTITPMAVVGMIGCKANIYVRPSQFGQSHYPITGALEVIDVYTWTYLSYKTFTITGPGGYKAVTSSTWVPSRQNVFGRIVVNGDGTDNTMDMDNLSITCTY